MSTLVDAILAWKARLTTRATPEQILALRADVNAIADYVRFLEAENAKLREELAKARDPQRIGGQADPSSFAYAIEQLREFRWQHATNDEDAIPYINNVAAAHERENAELREEVEQWHRLTAGIELPEYPITEFKPKDLDRENAKLRELLVGAFEDMNTWQMVIAGSNEWGYGKGCLDRLYELRNAMQELGMEVVV